MFEWRSVKESLSYISLVVGEELKVESGNLKVVYKNLQFQKSSFMRIYIKLLSFKQSTIQTFLENFPLSTFNFQLQKFANPSFYYTIYF